MKRRLGAFSAIALAASGLTAHASSLDGLTVSVEWLYPVNSRVFASQNVTVGTGPEIVCPGPGGICGVWLFIPVEYDFGSDFISFLAPNGTGLSSAAFNGFRFSGLNVGGPWSSVSLSTNVDGLDSSRVSFDGGTLLINLQGIFLPTDGSFTLTLNQNPVPLPSSAVLFASMLTVIGCMRRMGRS